jgi:hypothetical protein
MSGVLTLISFTPLEKSSAKVTQRSRRADHPARVNTIGSQSPVRLLAAVMTNPGTYRCRTRKVTL